MWLALLISAVGGIFVIVRFAALYTLYTVLFAGLLTLFYRPLRGLRVGVCFF